MYISSHRHLRYNRPAHFSITALYSTDNDNRVKSLSKLHKRLISSLTSPSLFQTKLLFHSHAPNKASLNPLFSPTCTLCKPILNQKTTDTQSNDTELFIKNCGLAFQPPTITRSDKKVEKSFSRTSQWRRLRRCVDEPISPSAGGCLATQSP